MTTNRLIPRLRQTRGLPWPNLSWLLTLLLLPVLFHFLANYGTRFLPRSQAMLLQSPVETPVRIISWNALYSNRSPEALVARIAELQPDIVAIQELSFSLSTVIEQQLLEQFPHQALYPAQGPFGMAVLSRYPLLAERAPDLRQHGGCNCQEVTLDLDGQPITLINTHPWPPRFELARFGPLPVVRNFSTANQDIIFDTLLSRIRATTHPLLVVGDLNTTEYQPNYARINAQLTDAFTTAGWGMGYTFPEGGSLAGIPLVPLIRIDYIFHDQQWQATEVWVGSIAGSDHRYVAADLWLLAKQ